METNHCHKYCNRELLHRFCEPFFCLRHLGKTTTNPERVLWFVDNNIAQKHFLFLLHVPFSREKCWSKHKLVLAAVFLASRPFWRLNILLGACLCACSCVASKAKLNSSITSPENIYWFKGSLASFSSYFWKKKMLMNPWLVLFKLETVNSSRSELIRLIEYRDAWIKTKMSFCCSLAPEFHALSLFLVELFNSWYKLYD